MRRIDSDRPGVKPGGPSKERPPDGEWINADPHHPCPVCHEGSWCGWAPVEDGYIVCCMRTRDPTDARFRKAKMSASGQEVSLYHLRDDEIDASDGRPSAARAAPDPEDVFLRREAYRGLIAVLDLSTEHRAALKARGLSDADIEAGRFRSMPPPDVRIRVADRAREWVCISREHIEKVPGFGRTEHGLRLLGPMGLVIPMFEEWGHCDGIQLRPDNPIVIDGKPVGKYVWLSSGHGGPRARAVAHIPPHEGHAFDLVRLTEGGLKAHVATVRSGLLTIGVPGVWQWRTALPSLKTLKVRTVRLAFDADYRTNPEVAKALVAAYSGLKAEDYVVEVETWDPEHKGIDDALTAGADLEVLTGDEAEKFVEGLCESADERAGRSSLPRVVVTHKLHEVVAQAVEALARDPEVFQANKSLVRMVRNARPPKGLKDTEGTPQIHAIPVPRILELMSRCASWMRWGEDKSGRRQLVPTSPAEKFAKMVAARCDWPGVNPLEGIIEAPTMRADGTILQDPGYDRDTGLYFLPGATFPRVPDLPTAEDALASANRLLGLVVDFPFASDDHRYAWLAACITVVVRHAIPGPVPAFVFDANVSGAGKTKLADIIAIIANGRGMPRSSYSQVEEEMRKQLLAIALGGFPFVLFDNLQTGDSLGGPSLDRALTSMTVNDRLLGQSKMSGDVPFYAVIFATGNNLGLKGDALRRVISIRLDSPEERPEERDGFAIPGNLLDHVRENRPALVVAALSIVRGYVVAGCPPPDPKLTPMDYPAWSGLIRHAIHWATGKDPCATRKERAAEDDASAELAGLIAGWESLCVGAEATSLTAAEAIRALEAEPNGYASLRAILTEWSRDGKLPSGHTIGNRLKKVRGKVSGGKALDFRTYLGNRSWFVRPAGRPFPGGSGDSGDTVSNPARKISDDNCRRDISEADEKLSHQSHQSHQSNGAGAREVLIL